MPDERSRGLIGVPHQDTVPFKFAHSMIKLATDRFGDVGDVNIHFLGNHLTHVAREEIADAAIKDGYDWLCFLDSDMAFPADVLKRLLAWDLPVVGGLCFKRKWPPLPTLFKVDVEADNGGYDANGYIKALRTLTEWSAPLQEVDATGCACLLIRREALEAVPPPRFELNPWSRAEDLSFCVKLRKAGIPIHIDTTLQIGHCGMYDFAREDYKRFLREYKEAKARANQDD